MEPVGKQIAPSLQSSQVGPRSWLRMTNDKSRREERKCGLANVVKCMDTDRKKSSQEDLLWPCHWGIVTF